VSAPLSQPADPLASVEKLTSLSTLEREVVDLTLSVTDPPAPVSPKA